MKLKLFQEKDQFDPQFQLGTVFTSKEMFRTAVHSLALKTKKPLKIGPNDHRRMYVRCTGGRGCNFTINAGI